MADTNELGGFIQSLRCWPERPGDRRPGAPARLARRRRHRRDLRLAARRNGRAALQPPAGRCRAAGPARRDGRRRTTPDVEGEVLERCAACSGPTCRSWRRSTCTPTSPSGWSRAADALVLYHTAPHIDVFETGPARAAVLRRILVDGARPVTAFQKLPLVVPAERANTQDPASVSYGFRERLQECGAPSPRSWRRAGDRAAVARHSRTGLGGRGRDGRRRGAGPRMRADWPATSGSGGATICRNWCPWPKRCVQPRRRSADGLVVLSDSADATTSGAPGDSTGSAARTVEYDWPRPALVTLVDPELVAEADDARGIGAELTAALGGKRDRRFSPPLPLTVARGGPVRRPLHPVGPPGPQPADRHGTVGGLADWQRPHRRDIALGAALFAATVRIRRARPVRRAAAGRQKPMRLPGRVSGPGQTILSFAPPVVRRPIFGNIPIGISRARSGPGMKWNFTRGRKPAAFERRLGLVGDAEMGIGSERRESPPCQLGSH